MNIKINSRIYRSRTYRSSAVPESTASESKCYQNDPHPPPQHPEPAQNRGVTASKRNGNVDDSIMQMATLTHRWYPRSDDGCVIIQMAMILVQMLPPPRPSPFQMTDGYYSLRNVILDLPGKLNLKLKRDVFRRVYPLCCVFDCRLVGCMQM